MHLGLQLDAPKLATPCNQPAAPRTPPAARSIQPIVPAQPACRATHPAQLQAPSLQPPRTQSAAARPGRSPYTACLLPPCTRPAAQHTQRTAPRPLDPVAPLTLSVAPTHSTCSLTHPACSPMHPARSPMSPVSSLKHPACSRKAPWRLGFMGPQAGCMELQARVHGPKARYLLCDFLGR